MRTVEEMIKQYVSAWNEKELDSYTREFAKCWAAEATYTDPNYDLIKGVDGLANLAYSSLAIMPERTFRVLTSPDYHHNVGRYYWTVDLPGEQKEGFDYFEFNKEFKITRLVSFFGSVK